MKFGQALMHLVLAHGMMVKYSALLVSGNEECTRGRLFVAETETSTIRVFETGSGQLSAAGTVPTRGQPGQFLYPSGTHSHVASIYRGSEDVNFADGSVSFVSTGVAPDVHEMNVASEEASLIEDFDISCTRPIHYVAHEQRMAFFCDGFFVAGDSTSTVNSTVWVVDEREFGNGINALEFTKTLSGSHHGVCVPVDDGHVLISTPTPERVGGDAEASALPNGFEVFDYDGNVLHGLNEADDPSTSCQGFHGSGITPSAFGFACNQDHGGVLVVEYGQTDNVYTSRALSYPDGFEGHRTGSFAEHPSKSLLVGNFADRATGSSHLISIDIMQPHSEIAEDEIQELTAAQCSFVYEQSQGDLVLVWMPTGRLHVYAVDPFWTLVHDLEVLPGMTDCSGTSLVAGHGHAYILTDTQVHDVDLEMLTVAALSLGFTPNSGVVSGVPSGYECPGPSIPMVPLTPGEGGTTGFAVLQFVDEEEAVVVLTPGSMAQTEFVLHFRKDLAEALGVGIDRIFVLELQLQNDDDQDKLLLMKLFFADPTGSWDANQETGNQLYRRVVTMIESENAAIMDGPSSGHLQGSITIDIPSQFDVEAGGSLNGNTNNQGIPMKDAPNDDGLSTGVIVALAIGGVIIIGGVTAMITRRGQKEAVDDTKNPGEPETPLELEDTLHGQSA